MDVRINKIDGEYFATFLDFKQNIKSYYVKKSFDLSEPVVKDFHFNLNDQKVDIYSGNINIHSPSIKLEPLNDIRHFYTIVLITDNGLSYPLYVDFNKLYGIKMEDDIYHYNFMKPIFKDKNEYKYEFFIKGSYGDSHKIDLFDIKNINECFFKIPEKKSLLSESYEITCELNGNRIFKGPFAILPKDFVSFSVDYQDMGENLKVKVRTKFNTAVLDMVSITHNGKVIREEKREKLDMNKIIRELVFYIPASGINNENNLILDYEASESKVNSDNQIKKQVLITLNEKKEQVEIYDFKQEYSFDNDNLFLSWKNKAGCALSYNVNLSGKQFITNDTFLNIERFSEFNNNQATIEGLIKCSDLKKLINKNPVELKIVIDNKVFTHSSSNFTPIIDYSKTLYCNKPFGRLKWSSPNFKHYVKVKVETELNSAFLDEFGSPWVKDRILDKTVGDFDKKYKDYEKQYVYNFSEGKEVSKSPNDSTICYDILNGQWLNVENENGINIPLWFNKTGSKYKVFIEIYDSFNKFIGKSETEFTVIDEQIGEIGIENLRIDRLQNMQFGESGTVGEFYKVKNPKPIDVRNHYSQDFRTFTGQPLNDKTNIDKNGNSLFYYINTNENDYFEIRYNRLFNFYKVDFIIEKEDEVINKTSHTPAGNNFSDNLVKIRKDVIKSQGEYKMKIQTFNSSGQASKVKEVSFFVHNEKPEKPFVRIKADDFIQDGEEITINKKYFEIEVTNNDLSQKYSGWKFKETHFFFRTLSVPFLQFADYVIQTDVSDGSIVFKNSTPIENEDYECKIINYDYSGNASEPHIFK
ncbi:MAG: hypothetical protein ACRC0G_13080, partial [Fusobacteriaceae bacterium]